MADKKDAVYINAQDWQVKPFNKTGTDGKENLTYIITLSVDKVAPDKKADLAKRGSLDGYATIEVKNAIQKDQGRWSIPLEPNKIYAERYVKNIVPEAQVDKKGEPVINPKTGKQYDLKEYGYRQITGAAIAERENLRYEEYKKTHPQEKAAEAPEKAAEDKPLDKGELEGGIDDITFDV